MSMSMNPHEARMKVVTVIQETLFEIGYDPSMSDQDAKKYLSSCADVADAILADLGAEVELISEKSAKLSIYFENK